ncbi:M48 family metallopeptidase [Solimicrobium silvestre]|uniref:Peptidase family M48 n=1 Tax=Solimicrobium silvestre TaxID=2099400 RepID=A0A2S9H4E7_9BURK|nr:M48 family metallopeptidase [Solimicrobium silvestre]PRC94860.1 Peptidase family M48 [Solimicrobium silvestre]
MISARYFDGKTSRLHHVHLSVENNIARITGDIVREATIQDLRVSERTTHAARRVTFPDGAYLETFDHEAFNAMLSASGYQDSWVVRLQQNWRATIAAALFTIVLLLLTYLYALPSAAKYIANNLPDSVEQTMGKEALSFLDARTFSASKLPLEQQEKINSRFQQLCLAQDSSSPVELVFRSSKIGPNAFALPSRQIVLTDEIVTLLDNDDELMSILSHELGHLHEHHFTRRLIQSSVIAAGATLLFGDVSAVIAGVPTLLLDLKYSRDVERDADDYAVALLKKNNIAVENFAQAFEKMDKLSKGMEPIPYMSTHPITKERIKRVRQAE